MKTFEPISILCLNPASASPVDAFVEYLGQMPHVRCTTADTLSAPPTDVHVVMTTGDLHGQQLEKTLSPFVKNGGAWLHAAGSSSDPLPETFGAQPQPMGRPTEIRILFTDSGNPMAERLADACYVPGQSQELNVTAADVETVVYADWHYTHRAVLVRRPVGQGHAACTTLAAFDHPGVQRILYRLIRSLSGQAFGQAIGVGLLGYAPSVGRLHGLGCRHTPGLNLVAACDLSRERLAQARLDFPDIDLYPSSRDLAADPNIDLVIVATPPNSHADLCVQMMAAGKHVVCEKPLALFTSETAALIQAAETYAVHLSCHQNRRFDADYLAIRNAVAKGLIGEPFYLETFVGRFSHPCGYWHSHAPVSGGSAYDWGAHYLDWIVSLFPLPIAAVIGTRHKRVWHDVTNADQERIQIRFAGGQEAEFIHSDVAAFRKPKWFLLGTEGAIVGHWQDVTVYEPDPDHYFFENDIPATEMTPNITIYRRQASGQGEVIHPEIPAREPYAYHRNLADHLLCGEALATPLHDSVKVVAILEAAARSMDKGGCVEELDV